MANRHTAGAAFKNPRHPEHRSHPYHHIVFYGLPAQIDLNQQPGDVASIMEGSKDLHRFIVPYGNAINTPNILAQSAIAALRFCSALAEERGNHNLAETILHFADIHHTVGATRCGLRKTKAEIEFRETILARYLYRAVNLDAEVDDDVTTEDGQKKLAEMVNKARLLLQEVKSRTEGNQADRSTLEHKTSFNEVRFAEETDIPDTMDVPGSGDLGVDMSSVPQTDTIHRKDRTHEYDEYLETDAQSQTRKPSKHAPSDELHRIDSKRRKR